MRWLLTLFIVYPLFGTAYVTTATDTLWSNQLHWSPTGVPGNGDTVTINHLTDVDVNTTIGASLGGGNNSVIVQANLTVLPGITFIVRGDLYLNGHNFYVSAGSTYTFDPSGSTGTNHYRVYSDNAYQDNLVQFSGTAGAHVTVNTNTTGSHGNGWFQEAWFTSMSYVGSYVDFTNVGYDTAHPALHNYFYGASVHGIQLDHCTFTNSGGIAPPSASASPGTNTPFILDYIKMEGCLGVCLLTTPNTSRGSATWRVSHSSFSGVANDTSGNWGDFVVTDNYLGDTNSTTYGAPITWARNIARTPSQTGINVMGTNLTKTYVLLDYDDTNPGGVNALNTTAFTFDTGVVQYTGTGGDGDLIVIEALQPIGSEYTAYIKNVIMLMNRSQGQSSGTISSQSCLNCSGQSHPRVSVEHTTYPGAERGIKGNEQGPWSAGMVASARSNLYWDRSARAGPFTPILPGAGPLADNIADPANVDYNGNYNAITYSAPGKTNDGTVYQIPMTGTVPGTHDVNGQNPLFVDTYRSIVNFDQGYLGKSTGTAWVTSTGYSVGDIVSQVVTGSWNNQAINYRAIVAHTSGATTQPGIGTSWRTDWEYASLYWVRQATGLGTVYTDATIYCGSGCYAPETALNWVRNGFAPTNVAYHNTAHDGGDIGAVPYQATGGPLTISPLAPTIKVGTTQTFTATGGTGSYTWSKTTGGLGSIDSGTGVYTAPASIAARNTALGVQLHSNSHIYNTRIDSLPVISTSATWLGAGLNAYSFVCCDPDFPLNKVLSTDSSTFYTFYPGYTTPNNGYFIFPPVSSWRTELGYYLYNVGGTDKHTISVQTDSGVVGEIYKAYPLGFLATPLGSVNATSGVQFANMSTTLPINGGTTAGNSELTPLIFKKSELVAPSPAILHAIRFTAPGGFINAAGHMWPAPGGFTENGAPPYGARLRLKSSFTLTPSGSCNSSCQAVVSAIILGLKNYGAVLDDISGGGCCSLSAEQATYPDYVLQAWSEISYNIPLTQVEIVDQSSLKISDSSGEVAWGNGYVTPSGVQICVTDGTSSTCTIPKLQAITVGTDLQAETIQAGSGPHQLSFWVNGATNTALTYTMSPTVGSLNASTGVYTPPTTITANTKSTTTVTATSVADSSVSITKQLTILPSGTMYVNIGDAADYTDGSGNVWFAEFKSGDPEIGPISFDRIGNNAGITWSGTSDPLLYQYSSWGGVDDKFYQFRVANGTYRVTMYFGQKAGVPAGYGSQDIQVQGTTVYPAYDIVAVAGGTLKATSLTYIATVVNNKLSLAYRWEGVLPTTNDPCCTTPLYSNSDAAPIVAALKIESLTTSTNPSFTGKMVGGKLK